MQIGVCLRSLLACASTSLSIECIPVKHVQTQRNAMPDRRAGDGTTTSIIMTQAIVNQGVKYVKSGMNPVSLREGILRASKAVGERLPELARKVQSVEDIVNIATVSTGGEKAMAQTIAAVFERVGMDAKVISVM